MLLNAGCAGGPQEESDSEPVVPPEVADSSIDEGEADEPVVIPRVAVEVETDTDLDPAAARAPLERDAKHCYRRALQHSRELEARAVYELVVTSEGRVAGAEEVSMNASNRRLEACLERSFRKLRFETQPGNEKVISRMYVRLRMWREVHEADEPSL
ncbi:MAG: AgmX/PglI C-terminal domain-containing protein [Persicimonas sp.]